MLREAWVGPKPKPNLPLAARGGGEWLSGRPVRPSLIPRQQRFDPTTAPEIFQLQTKRATESRPMPDSFTLDPGKTIQLPAATKDEPITVVGITGELRVKRTADAKTGTKLTDGARATLTETSWLTAVGEQSRALVIHGRDEERPQRSRTPEQLIPEK